MKAFITGSHAYGTPTAESDVDLVVRCDPSTAAMLLELLYEEPENAGEKPAPPEEVEDDYERRQFKIGKLNLLLCTSDQKYDEWLIGTSLLRGVHGKTTRERAVSVFSALRENGLKAALGVLLMPEPSKNEGDIS